MTTKWEKAQQLEYALWRDQPEDADDWNGWWALKFDMFESFDWKSKKSILEVGCGPYARNIRHFIDHPDEEFSRIAVEDPLLQQYINDGKWVWHVADRIHCEQNAQCCGPLEELRLAPFEILVCINVLDHVRDLSACLESLWLNLDLGGYLILGQDLTNEEDKLNCPEMVADEMHPVKIDLGDLDQLLDRLKMNMFKVLPRAEGRNPSAHYGTLIYVGQKI